MSVPEASTNHVDIDEASRQLELAIHDAETLLRAALGDDPRRPGVS